jgi:integrase
VAELLLAFLKFAEREYRTPDGSRSSSLEAVRQVARRLKQGFAFLPAAEFGPKDLKAFREGMVAEGLARKVVNGRVGLARRIFRWGVAEELIPAEVDQRLRAVDGLRAGRTDAPDHPPVVPADPADVEAALPHMPPMVATVVRLQRMTGARCGELLAMRPCDIDRSNPDAWVYTPSSHKGAWRGKGRAVFLGKRCQELLAPWVLKAGGPDGYVFSPVRAEAERNAERSAKRITPRWPSHAARNEAKRKSAGRRRPPRERYGTQTVRQAIERACVRAGVPVFTPHQLRHLAATEIRAELGPEVARAILGHTLASMTEVYSRAVDRQLALQAVARFG